jgi:hypothetical protein
MLIGRTFFWAFSTSSLNSSTSCGLIQRCLFKLLHRYISKKFAVYSLSCLNPYPMVEAQKYGLSQRMGCRSHGKALGRSRSRLRG